MTKENDKKLYKLNVRKGTVREREETPYEAELRRIREAQAADDAKYGRDEDDSGEPVEITVSLGHLKRISAAKPIGEDRLGLPIYGKETAHDVHGEPPDELLDAITRGMEKPCGA